MFLISLLSKGVIKCRFGANLYTEDYRYKISGNIAITLYMYKIMLGNKKMSSLLQMLVIRWIADKLVKRVLTFTYGRAAMERGFNVNKEAILEYQLEKSLVVLRFVLLWCTVKKVL